MHESAHGGHGCRTRLSQRLLHPISILSPAFMGGKTRCSTAARPMEALRQSIRRADWPGHGIATFKWPMRLSDKVPDGGRHGEPRCEAHAMRRGEHARLGAYSGRWAAWSGTMRALEPRWLGDPALVLGPWRAMSSMRHSISGDGGAVRRGE
jgi:hypothetical protein